MPEPCPSLSHSKGRLGILQLVSFTLKRSHFRALFSIFLLVFRACCLKCLHAPFCSSVLPLGPAALHWGGGGESQMGSGCSEPGQALLQCPGLTAGFGLFPLGYQLCPWSGVRQAGARVPCSPRAAVSHPSPSPGVLFARAGAEAGQAEPARQAASGRAACAPALAGQGVQSRLPPRTAFPVLLPPGK